MPRIVLEVGEGYRIELDTSHLDDFIEGKMLREIIKIHPSWDKYRAILKETKALE